MVTTARTIFLGGAPKCGTSSLFAALAAHEEIVGSTPKEPFFFLDEGHPLLCGTNNVHVSEPTAHASLFPKGHGSRYQMDGTTHLLYQQQMPQILAEHYPSARFLFILRDPIERLRSSFTYTENNLGRLLKPISFAEFVELSLDQQHLKLEKMIAAGPSRYVLPRDLEYGKYEQYLKNWCQYFPAEQIKLVTYEAYRENANLLVGDVLEWLGLSSLPPREQSPQRNRTVQIRDKRLHRWAQSFARRVPAGKIKAVLKSGYLSLQTASPVSYTLPDTLRKRLRAYYLPTVEALRDKYQLDTTWL
jgi:hypothetical protein